MTIEINAQQVKELREATGVGLMEAKNALVAVKGNMEEAIKALRESGKKIAAKKSDRVTNAGTVASYIHGGGKVGALVQIACETDFVAKTDVFQNFAKDMAMHIAAMSPTYIAEADIPAAILAEEKAIALKQLEGDNKPDEIKEKIVAGKIAKYAEENCLLNQPFFKDDTKKVSDILTEVIAQVGENIRVVAFTKYKIG